MKTRLLRITVRALILSAFILFVGIMGKADMEDEIATQEFYNELAVQTQCLP